MALLHLSDVEGKQLSDDGVATAAGHEAGLGLVSGRGVDRRMVEAESVSDFVRQHVGQVERAIAGRMAHRLEESIDEEIVISVHVD